MLLIEKRSCYISDGWKVILSICFLVIVVVAVVMLHVPPISFNKLLAQKEELEQKHLHLLQIVESEKTAKWQYTRQCEELTDEIKQLRTEV